MKSLSAYLEVKRGLGASPEERAIHQRREFATLVRRAYENVPFYTRLYDARGIHPSRVTDPSQIPIVTKQSLRSVPDTERLSRELVGQRLRGAWSSGSTGEPLRTLMSPESGFQREVLAYYVHHAHGIRPSERIVQLTTAPPLPSTGQVSHLQYDAELERMLLRLSEWGTSAIWGFPSYIALLAEENLRRKERVGLRLVVSLGEAIEPRARELIAASFGAEVREVYGASELGLVGVGCASGGGYHVSPNYLLEVVDSEGQVKEQGAGELCISAFGQHAMPVIRYNIKDVGTLDETPCDCGLRAPRIVGLAGREGAPFYDRQGRGVSLGNLYFYHHLPEDLLRVSIVQRAQGRLDIDVVPTSRADRSTLEQKLRGHIDALYGDRFHYALRIRDANDTDLLGKRLALVSRVKAEDVRPRL